MNYTARFPNEAIQKKFLKKLNRLPAKAQTEIMDAIQALENNPHPFGAKPFKQLKPPVAIYHFAAQYRVRIGDWRVLYDVDDKKYTIWIFALRKRNERTYSG